MSAPQYVAQPQSRAQILPDVEEDQGEDIQIENESTTNDTAPVDSTVDELNTESQSNAQETPSNTDDDELPPALRGKSSKDLAKMYLEAQKVIGRQGAEVSEVRKLADSLIRKQLADQHRAAAGKTEPAKPAASSEDMDTEFFKKPSEAIAKAVSEHPDIKSLREAAAQAVARERAAAAKAAVNEFKTQYPDAGEILADESFREWVGVSKVRQALFKRAHQAFDLDAANEIFGTWKALQKAKTPAAPAAKPRVDKKAVSAAAVPTGNAGNPGEKSGKKIYRRVDIMRLMENDPDRYEALAPEIQKAYEEGRVR
jgi:hypothetical protein